MGTGYEAEKSNIVEQPRAALWFLTMLVMFNKVGSVFKVAKLTNNTTPTDQARLLINTHINALNKRDVDAIAATLHFPHHRLSGTTWKTWDTVEHYFDDFLARAGTNWQRSSAEDIKVVDSSANKVHLDVEIRRYDAKDSLITSFRSLWVIVKINGVWAAKIRSSFASS